MTAFQIPDTRKKVFQQKVLQATNPMYVIYKGRTVNATPAELFINGVSGVSTDRNRVYVPNDACIVGRFQATAIITTTGAQVYHATGLIGINNDGGTTATTAVAAKVEHLDTGTAYDITFTANDTEDALICTVTGTANSVLWVVNAELICASVLSLPPYGDS